MSFVEEVVAAAVAAVVVGVLLWFFLPLRNRLERVRLKVTSDHGLALRTYPDADSMGGLSPEELLGAQASWLSDEDFYFRDGVPAEAPPRRQSHWSAWARRNGGEPVGWRHVLLHIQATQDHSVLLRKPIANVRRTEVAGGVVLSPFKELGGNGLMVRQFRLELDEVRARVEYYPEGGPSTPQFTMAKGSTEAFVVIAHAARGRYEWTLDIPALVDGVNFDLRVDDGGKPFISVGGEGVDAKWWRFDKKAWQSAEW